MKPVMLAQPDESRAASIQITRPRGPTSRPPLCLPLRPERERLGRRQRHVLQVGLARPTDVGQRADVGMIEPRSGAGLALEAGAHLGRRGQVRGLDLDGDITAEAGVAGSIHLAHRPARRQPCTVRGCCLRPAWSLSRRRADDSAPNLRLPQEQVKGHRGVAQPKLLRNSHRWWGTDRASGPRVPPRAD
jgi:hypothetical protein